MHVADSHVQFGKGLDDTTEGCYFSHGYRLKMLHKPDDNILL